jgi:2-succinyl-5-enolpyruvyl-6-hydroxy-3-cyclohexene-1-carboxylate synthase
MRAARRKLVQAVTLATGPHPGPVHVDLAFVKPLEPIAASAEERALVPREPIVAAAPHLAADRDALRALARAIAAAPDGLIVAGAMPAGFAAARDRVFALAARTGYPLAAETGSQLRLGPRPGVLAIDHLDFARGPRPSLIVQLGAEPVSASATDLAGVPRWVLADHAWRDPDSSARGVIVGDVAASIDALVELVAPGSATSYRDAWREADALAAAAIDAALVTCPRSEAAVLRAAIGAAPADAVVQIGNSLPIRVVDWVCGGGAPHAVLTQRGASGIDGLIASAAGATRAGRPVLLVLGDVSFAHDVGGLLAARAASAPLAIVVVDNRGGQIFAQLPIARTATGATLARYFLTAPEVDPTAIATGFGARALTAASPAAVATAVATALVEPGTTVIHAPVSASGARDVRAAALAALAPSQLSRRSS